MFNMLSRKDRSDDSKAQMPNVSETAICKEDGGGSMVVVEPPCKNRIRSTIKCRRQCCRRKVECIQKVDNSTQSRLVAQYSTRSLRELAEMRIAEIEARGATVHGLNLPDSGSRRRKDEKPSPPVNGKEDAKCGLNNPGVATCESGVAMNCEARREFGEH